MKTLIYKFGTVLACLALCITSLNVNTTCMLFVHQPKIPNNANKLRKFWVQKIVVKNKIKEIYNDDFLEFYSKKSFMIFL